MQTIWVFLLFFILTASAQARVFNINNEHFASYILLNAGPSSLKQTPFSGETVETMTYDGTYSYNYGGEFGFVYTSTAVNFRFGIGILRPLPVTTIANNGSTDMYTVKNDISGYVPKIGLEINLHKTDNFRLFAVGTYGAASITLKNEYTLTTTGSATYSGIDTTMYAKGTANELYGGLGGEVHFTDTTTFLFEAGYRTLEFTKLTYTKDVVTFTGTQTAGSTVLDGQGNKRTLNMGGSLLTLGLRFYL